ncbi:hypothetical protein WJX81_004476 [Elliptochloris bilobata]|uniref:Carbohydrate binding module family 25 domain-containing protein n=1 Tax=Elliptochloris bilobata TaxID=381761 RepID=A0AAW1RU01_9CHLO
MLHQSLGARSGWAHSCVAGSKAHANRRSSGWQVCAAKEVRRGSAAVAPPDAAKLTPEMLAMFSEAQRNIMELNKSRLAALSELRIARQRIQKLEAHIAAAEAQAALAPAQVPAQTAAQTAAPAPPLQLQAPARAVQPPAPPAPPAVDTVTLEYQTGWGRTFLHYKADGGGWTAVPGVLMEAGGAGMPGCQVLSVAGRRLEFVVNNGGHDWDTPDPYGSGRKNYVIDAPGRYRLKSGRIARLG